MTLIVSDTSPLNLLILVDQVGVLPLLFDEVLIPSEVARELGHPKASQGVRDFIRQPPLWLTIQDPAKLLSLPNLDSGEAAAISLAVEIGASVLIDESAGREAAKRLDVQPIGAIGVLERAANGGHIKDLQAVYQKISTLRFHISDAILEESLRRHRSFGKRS